MPGDYQAVKRLVRKLRGPQCREAAGIIVTAPGEEAQVDYGSGPMVRDPQSGKYRPTRLFVLTLGYSRKCVRLVHPSGPHAHSRDYSDHNLEPCFSIAFAIDYTSLTSLEILHAKTSDHKKSRKESKSGV